MSKTPAWAINKAKEIIDAAETRGKQALKQIPTEYHEFLVFLPQSVKVGAATEIDTEASNLGMYAITSGTYVSVSYPYMAVNGRVKQARDDHRAAGKLLHFEEPVIAENKRSLKVTIHSELLGSATGSSVIPSSENAKGAEKDNPLEVAETSAIGRALGFLGYGLIGSGIASAEEVQLDSEATEKEVEESEEPITYGEKEKDSNAPESFRVKVLELPTFKPDGSCHFAALTEKSARIQIIMPKKHKEYMDSLGVKQVIIVSGWLTNNRLRVDVKTSPIIEDVGVA
ncbi:hypothetical protein [Bacillus sp. UMB0728]|uniref:hypothetical protein n=1 Tax=Bacillus sp. UMB0728 TaxID=2066052 RepID=UPI000C762E58|nr:hypothetical protein [Bacillus sp. UMB0728]PLR70505.1 hypothetical protein CYJ37_23515 [Bacillus sp. UMB0728]